MLGVCYYPEHWPEEWWRQDARRMGEMGISYVRIGEFAWSRIEPRRGQFAWDWLDRAVDVLASEGLKVVIGTPTATPPKWLMDEFPEIAPVDQSGHQRGFGSRRHYTFSSRIYWQESARIVEAVAARYGRHAAVAGWQTDNEYGCHNTVLSWGPEDLKAFRKWLRHRYQSPERLNEAWGNAFWSMEVQDFGAVALPNLAVTEVNPAARLDFWRFQSEQVAAYDRMQCDIIRRHSPGRWITHNFMGFFNEFDHWAVGDNLDLASWDSYPVGFVERFPFPEEERNTWALTSHPDIAPFHHDLYRGVGRGRFWVMEQQPGPVNWAPWNPAPAKGMVRLWTWEALAHGAEVVSYFRWRQAVAAQEQMHAGLNLPGRHELSQGGLEASQCGSEIAALGALPATRPAPVAIVYDYEAAWITTIGPQGADFRFYELVFRWYEAVRRCGLDVDFVRPGASLDGYALALVPTLPHVSQAAERAFAAFGGTILFGPRSGSKTRHFGIPPNLPPGPLQELLGLRVLEVSSLRPGLEVPVAGAVAGSAARWTEKAAGTARVLARFAGGDGAFFGNGKRFYLACWPDRRLLRETIALVLSEAGLPAVALPPHIRIRRRGELAFCFNYGGEPWQLPEPCDILLGKRPLAPHDVAIWRT